MTAQHASLERAFFDLSPRLKLSVSGADRLRFLNGQLTNDVRKATERTAVEACVLNPKGKMDAHLFIHIQGDSFLLDADPLLQSSLQARLERYIIADDVQIEDVTTRLSIFHALGGSPPKLSVPARVVSADRFGRPGHDIWIEATQHDELAAELSKGFAPCNDNCAEIFRIEQGIARWGRELTGEIIPVEANLEKRCIDYEKGCYIGQETISRIKMSGQRNKQLCGLLSLKNVPFVAGMRLIARGEVGAIDPNRPQAERNPREIGWITSATRSAYGEIALAYVKRGFNSVGSKLEAASAEGSAIPAEIVDLPFLSR